MTDDRETTHVMGLNGHIGAASAFNLQNKVNGLCSTTGLLEACFGLF